MFAYRRGSQTGTYEWYRILRGYISDHHSHTTVSSLSVPEIVSIAHGNVVTAHTGNSKMDEEQERFKIRHGKTNSNLLDSLRIR